MKTKLPCRGEIWMIDLDPVRGHEQAGKRPALIISVDLFNQGPSGLAVVLPVTTKERKILFHVPVDPAASGLPKRSFIKCEDVRSISKERLLHRCGLVSQGIMLLVEDRLRILCGL